MFDYLQKFNSLPKELREKISSPEIMAALSSLENKYKLDLAIIIMKVMVKSLEIKNLPLYFSGDYSLDKKSAEDLTRELTEKIFSSVSDYLNIDKEKRGLDLDKDISLIIKEAQLILPSTELIDRLKTIISTYLRGIRSRASARDTFAKPVNFGGLSLSSPEIDRLLNVCDNKHFNSILIKGQEQNKPNNPLDRLDKIISNAETSSEYNLKQAIALGQIKKPEKLFSQEIKKDSNSKNSYLGKLDLKHEIAAPVKEVEISAPEEVLELVAPKEKLELITPNLKSIPIPTNISKGSDVGKIVTAQDKVILPQKITTSQDKAVLPQKITASQEKIILPQKLVVEEKKVVEVKSSKLGDIAGSRTKENILGSRELMHDIKIVPKVMGPIEELQFLNLVNFRRLGKTPEEATAKIFSKIKLLELDGYDKMIAGVKAWRQSPVNNLYLKMMKESINKDLKIKDFVMSLDKKTGDYLNLKEIEAILTINGKLIF